jgi:hypothetical protein
MMSSSEDLLKVASLLEQAHAAGIKQTCGMYVLNDNQMCATAALYKVVIGHAPTHWETVSGGVIVAELDAVTGVNCFDRYGGEALFSRIVGMNDTHYSFLKIAQVLREEAE